jgi:phage replication-related protein YjqB (UPF0714/DUF867 family)
VDRHHLGQRHPPPAGLAARPVRSKLRRLLHRRQRRHHLGPRLGSTEIADRYGSFAELATAETEGVTYAIRLIDRDSPVTVIAPHGGTIEPGTSVIAASIAAECYSFYCFEGRQPHRPHGDLHLTSTPFDEPRAVALIERSHFAVAIHGYLEPAPAAPILIGGRDTALIEAIAHELNAADYTTSTSGHRFPATDPSNICNRTIRHAGVQLELSRELRDHLRGASAALASFSSAVGRAIEARLATIG